MKDFVATAIVIISTLIFILAFLALLGWIIAVCVEVVFGIDFAFWQGAALLVLARLLLTRVNIINTNNDTKGRD